MRLSTPPHLAWLACALSVALALAGCDGSNSGTSSPDAAGAGALVLDAAPTGYHLTLDHALGVDDAAAATSSDPKALARTLAQTGFDGGWSRVWTSGDAYLDVVAIEASTAYGAVTLQQFQAQQLGAGRGVVPYPDADIPGSRAFDFFGTTRQGQRQVFCNGVLFSVDVWVFMVDDCSPAPRAPDRALAAARAQYQRAARLLGVPVATPASPAPTPT